MNIIKPIEELIGKDETITYKTRHHPFAILWPILIFIGGIILWINATKITSILRKGTPQEVGYWMVVGIAVIIFWACISRTIDLFTTEIAITDKQVLVKSGLFGIHTSSTLLHRIESLHTNQGILGRIFGFGTITLVGTGGEEETVTSVDHFIKFSRKLGESIPTPASS